MADAFGDMFGNDDFLKGLSKKVEKGIPWRAKEINDQYYVPLAQVAELLAQNDVLPKVRKGILLRVETLKMQKELGIE